MTIQNRHPRNPRSGRQGLVRRQSVLTAFARHPGLGVVAFATLCFAGPALAAIEVCNDTDLRQSVAIGYEDTNGAWTSEGWWQIAPGDCRTVMGRALDRSVFYYRATVAGGGFDGPYAFCTQSQPFTIVGDTDCAARGYEETRFREVRTDRAENFTLTLLPEGDRRKQAAESRDEHIEDGMVPIEVRVPFTQGQLGEPFTQTGIFAGCHTIDGMDYCGFEVEGWRYFALYGDGTPDALLDDLQGWPVPVAVELQGDMVNFGDITVEVALGRVTEVIGGDPFAGERQALQGTWRSLDDPASVMRIEGADVYDYYDGSFVDQQWMTLRQGCEGGPPGQGLGFVRMELETQDSWCLLVDRVDSTRLEMINPGRGNLLRYARE